MQSNLIIIYVTVSMTLTFQGFMTFAKSYFGAIFLANFSQREDMQAWKVNDMY